MGKPASSYQKLRGGYYTPSLIAEFLARWAIRTPGDRILEPSCGDGIILEAASRALVECDANQAAMGSILGIEVDAQEAASAADRMSGGDLAPPCQIKQGDFFEYCITHLLNRETFDAVIGNPPFIRYQNFPEPHRQAAFALMRRAGVRPTRLTNAWMPFLVAATLLLEPTGRLAMVIPAELLQVNYAAELRAFLGRAYRRLTLITFKKLVFDNIQQEVVLVLGEHGGCDQAEMRVVELDNVDSLATYEWGHRQTTISKPILDTKDKWTTYFLDPKEIDLLRAVRQHSALTPLGYIMDVDVGIVTGANEFFVLTEAQVKTHTLEAYTQPVVARSARLSGVVYSKNDLLTQIEGQAAAFLFTPPDLPPDQLPDSVRYYIADAEQRGIHTGYKCRIRERWYIVRPLWVPDAFMLRQVHSYPRLILNESNATCTDTIHRARMRNGTPAQKVAASFLNSFTFACSELTGRSYGGGILELEPNEAEALPLPLSGADNIDLALLDGIIRNGNIETALDLADSVLLRDGLGLSLNEIKTLRGAWYKLKDRRLGRKRR